MSYWADIYDEYGNAIDAPPRQVGIVWLQEWPDDAPEWDPFTLEGIDAMVEYMSQWDYGTETDMAADTAEPDTSDDIVTHTVGEITYTLATNRHLRYASLSRPPLPTDW